MQIAVATPLFTNFLFASHPFVTFRGMSKHDDRTTYKEMLIFCWTTARSSCVHQSDEFKLLKYVFDTLKVSLSSQNCLWSPPKLYVIFMLASLIWLITLFNFIYSRLQWKDFHFWWVKFQQSCLYISQFNYWWFITGGYNGILDLHFNDLHCFDPVKNVWHLVETRGTSPKARRRQSCVVIGKKMYLFGGTW